MCAIIHSTADLNLISFRAFCALFGFGLFGTQKICCQYSFHCFHSTTQMRQNRSPSRLSFAQHGQRPKKKKQAIERNAKCKLVAQVKWLWLISNGKWAFLYTTLRHTCALIANWFSVTMRHRLQRLQQRGFNFIYFQNSRRRSSNPFLDTDANCRDEFYGFCWMLRALKPAQGDSLQKSETNNFLNAKCPLLWAQRQTSKSRPEALQRPLVSSRTAEVYSFTSLNFWNRSFKLLV